MLKPRWFGLDVTVGGPADAHRSLDILAAADAATTVIPLIGRMARWIGPLGAPFYPDLAPLCSLMAVHGTPWLPSSTCYLAARAAAWLQAIDAWSDDHGTEPAAVESGVAHYLEVVRGAAPDPGDPLAVSLAEIRDDVRGGPSAAAVFERWQEATEATIVGMRFERRIADAAAVGGRPPELAEYLRHGAGSIGLAMMVTATWSSMEEPELPELIPDLRQPLYDASIAVRLANDLRGHRREQAEGNLDALALGLSPEELGDLLDEHLTRCLQRLRSLAAASPGPALALERLAIWSIRQYQRFDAGHVY
ncbi:hypothetical protein FHS43_001735 [Streptosporangium becharense]|uniref:Terpene synthase n=1 Tax=Streptosporangium becharense TaxID=1816182 RepID=A0A7W9IM02_9ACTN|nr:terpene synthase family protein [Streptosporangium becharense]MBB2910472.1 hypothetical protein [Streptosporangium becharense]MBB5823215.1 hypothetical protein [Streptosporangium becharense]